MNTAILSEVQFFLTSFFWGAFLFLIYDCLLISRNIIKQHRVIIAVEDILFWAIAGFYIFRMIYQLNHGTIRWYSIVGIALGMYMYNGLLSKHIINFFTTIITRVIQFIKKILLIIFRPIRFLLTKIKKLFLFVARVCKRRLKVFTSFLEKQLKKRIEKVRIKREEKKAKKKPIEVLEPVVHKSKKGSFELIRQPENKGDEHEQEEKKTKKNRS